MKYPVLVWWLALAVCVSAKFKCDFSMMDYGITWIVNSDLQRREEEFVCLNESSEFTYNDLQANQPFLSVAMLGFDWMFLPDGDGNPRVAYLNNPPASTRKDFTAIQMEFYESASIRGDLPNAIKAPFWIINNQIIHNETDSEKMIDKFNPDLDTKILVHGWMASTMSNSIQFIRDAYIERGNVNIFAIDWRDQADAIYIKYWPFYTEQVGRAVAYLIDLLVKKKGADSKRIHLIGHGLGVRIMGIASSFATNKVARITGLDPTFYTVNVHMDPLGNADADFVDEIHTTPTAEQTEQQYRIGHSVFFPNPVMYDEHGNNSQPGCAASDAGCTHGRSYEYYAESINSERGFYAVPCPTDLDAFEGKCSGNQILMGDPVPVTARGAYYLTTNEISPFAQGRRQEMRLNEDN